MSEFMGSSKCLVLDSPMPPALVNGYRLYSNRFCPFAKRVKIALGFLINSKTYNDKFIFSLFWCPT